MHSNVSIAGAWLTKSQDSFVLEGRILCFQDSMTLSIHRGSVPGWCTAEGHPGPGIQKDEVKKRGECSRQRELLGKGVEGEGTPATAGVCVGRADSSRTF